jgi:ectoine hydroxylase-related dioxygenase (phytanoyl-CoA dioxygenase family)
MKLEEIMENLDTKGYCIIPNILDKEEIEFCKQKFFEWYNNVKNIEEQHLKLDPHYIFKFHEVAHQEFAWFIKTNAKVIDIFKKIYKTQELVTSFDGCCYYPKNSKLSTGCWTHTDISPKLAKEMNCIQGFVSLTDNKNNSLLVYEGSNNEHNKYFKDKNMENEKNNWQKIDIDFLKTIDEKKKILNVSSGSVVLWDSRTFHQNIIQNMNEERLVQYVCYLPKNNKNNTESMKMKRLKYFNDRRVTSHWCYPIKVNGKQGNTWGNNNLKIDYSKLPKINLNKYEDKIMKLL